MHCGKQVPALCARLIDLELQAVQLRAAELGQCSLEALNPLAQPRDLANRSEQPRRGVLTLHGLRTRLPVRDDLAQPLLIATLIGVVDLCHGCDARSEERR